MRAAGLDDRIAQGVGVLALGILLLFIAFPLSAIFVKALQNRSGDWVGFTNIIELLTDQRFNAILLNSLFIAVTTSLIVIPLAFIYAYALTRSCLPFKPLWRLIALSPLLAPSLMPAISLVYLFGNQGFLRDWLPLFGVTTIYGPVGIVIGEAFYVFPHAFLIIATALAVADGRLYEAAEMLGASRLRRLITVTIPTVRYGVISAALVVFTLVVTDFGVPKVIGGQFNVLALEAYKQVIGQQNFPKGAVVGMILLIPALLAFAVERALSRHQSGEVTGRSVPLVPRAYWFRDGLCLGVCVMTAVILLTLIGMAVYASFVQFWPYNLSFSLRHYNFDNVDGGGWLAFSNSLQLASWTAFWGTLTVFFVGWLLAKTPQFSMVSQGIRALALMPMAVPGLVLGLGYIFYFNHPSWSGFYGTMAILVVSTIAHFYTTAHLTVMTALNQQDSEFEAVASSLGRSLGHSLWWISLPLSGPTLIEVARFFFVSAMTTVSGVIFLYTPNTVLAAVAVLNMDDAGDIGAAAAMSTLIVGASLIAVVGLGGLGWGLNRYFNPPTRS